MNNSSVFSPVHRRIFSPGNLFFLFTVVALLFSHARLPAHPADTVGDGRITLEEMTAYVSAWQNGADWQDGAPISETFMHRAVHLWHNGEVYREIQGVPAPFQWVPDPPGETFVSLADFHPEPLDVVEIFGLPVDPDAVSVTFTVTGHEGEFDAHLASADEGQPALVIPLNPYALIGGGQLTFRLADGDDVWIAGPIELQELPEAKNEIQMTRNAVVEWVEAFGQTVEVDITSMLHEPIDEVPAALLPLVALLHEIKGPTVQDNLDALLSGTAPSLDGEPLDLDFIERILHKQSSRRPLPDLNTPDPLALSTLAVATSDPTHSHQVEIDDGVDLALKMSQQVTAEQTLEALEKLEDPLGTLGERLDSIDGLLEQMETVFEADADVIGERRKDVKAAKRAAGYVGWFINIVEFINYYNNGVLPSRFVALSVQLDQDYIVEDNCDTPARISALASVSSRPVTYGAEKSLVPDFLDSVNIPDILPSFEVDVPTGRVTFTPTEITIDGEWVPEFTWSNIEIATGSLDNTDELISVEIANGPLQATPRRDGLGGSARIIGSEVRLNAESETYAGESGLATIDVRAKPEYFGGKTIQRFVEYDIRALNPLIIEHPGNISPGETDVEVRATLTNARSQGLDFIEWEVRDANGEEIESFEIVHEDGDIYLLKFSSTPESSDSYPLRVTFRSTTEECLRGHERAPVRESSVSIHAGGFIIHPYVSCLGEGSPQIFTAQWPDGEVPDTVTSVNWSIVEGGGTLDEVGPFEALYSPPAGSGIVILRAENSDDPDEYATRQFSVNCSATTNIKFLREEAFPPAPGVIQTDSFSSTFSTADIFPAHTDWIEASALFTIDEVVPVGTAGTTSQASGTFTGVGIAMAPSPHSPMPGLLFTFAAERNDSGNELEYDNPDRAGRTYNVSAGINLFNSVSPSKSMNLNGNRLEIEFDGERFSSAGSFDIVSYEWSAGGGSATGETAVLSFPVEAGTQSVQLRVTDTNGNTAMQVVYFNTVELDGAFSFGFLHSGASRMAVNSSLDLFEARSIGVFNGEYTSSYPVTTNTTDPPDGIEGLYPEFTIRYTGRIFD